MDEKETPLNLIEMLVCGENVRLLYGTGPTKEQSEEWIEMQVKSRGDDNRRLGVIQQAVLQRLRALLTSENRRFEFLSNQLP